MAEILCFTCKHRRTIPGNVHIRCGARVPDTKGEVANLPGGAGALMLAIVVGWADFDPCFPRPTNRAPITTCELYEKEAPRDS